MTFMGIDPYTGNPHRFAGNRAVQRSGTLKTNCRSLNADDREALDFVKKQMRKNNKKRNARGADDDRRQIIADLLSNDDSPFTPDDEDSLRSMTDDTLEHMRGQYLSAAEDVPEDDEPDDEDEPDVQEAFDDRDVEEQARLMGSNSLVDYIQRGKCHSAAEQRHYHKMISARRTAASIRTQARRPEAAWQSSALTKALKRDGAARARQAAAEKARAVALSQGRNRRAGQ